MIRRYYLKKSKTETKKTNNYVVGNKSLKSKSTNSNFYFTLKVTKNNNWYKSIIKMFDLSSHLLI